MNYKQKLKKLLRSEEKRQLETISLIPSENLALRAVKSALSSDLANSKYSEGYPGKRYYPGNVFFDEIETLCQELALKVFKLSDKKWAANVQPYSGSPANLAIYIALLRPGDKLLGMSLTSGGHLTHGAKISASGIFFRSYQYGLDQEGKIDYRELARLAKSKKPKVIVAGISSYPKKIDFKKFSQIAKSVNAYLVADISHIAGLIIAGLHPSCFPWADAVMFTTHKNFHGPRGGVIIAKKELAEKINKAVFPGVQGGPHNNQVLAKAIVLEEALHPAFKKYQQQVLKNTRTLADVLKKQGFKLFTGGTENHLFVLDLAQSNINATWAEKKLESVGILANRNALPRDKKPYRPSGQRFGTHLVTTRGMKEKEMKQLAMLITDTLLERKGEATIKQKVKKLAKNFIFNG